MSAQTDSSRVPWIFWPFVAIWRLLTGLLDLVGRLVLIVIGLTLGVIDVYVLSMTVIGAIVGVPLAILSLMLMVRGIF
ncbi:MAG: hypothetical protein R2854_13840 [Caldilineaceae bacterium]